MADRTRVPLGAVALPLRTQLRGGRLRWALNTGRANGGQGQPGALRAVQRRRLPPVQQLDHRVEVVDLDLARYVGAAEAQLPGARRACPRAAGERTWNTGPPPLVDGRRLPSQNSTAKGRAGSALSSSLRNGPVLANTAAGTAQAASVTAFLAWRSSDTR